MSPTEFNLLLTFVANYFYTNLDEKEFTNLAVFFSLLSKEMISLETIRELLKIEEELPPPPPPPPPPPH